MPKSRIDAIALFAAMIAAGLALAQVPEPLAWLSSIAGIVLLLTIFAYDREGYRSLFESLAFSAVCGFCAVVAAATGFRFWAVHNQLFGPNVRLAVDPLAGDWLPLTWACVTVVVWVIDRVRMNGRESAEYRSEVVRRSGSMFNIGSDVSAIRGADRVPVETRRAPEPAVVSVSTTQPAAVTPAPPPEAVSQGVSERPLKEAMVYVNLVGEGMNVMRSVRAEHVGRNFYRIVEPMPEEETWEYRPGQVVRCEKKKLSSGKALVAVEEAPRRA